jgi:hypothetical protein
MGTIAYVHYSLPCPGWHGIPIPNSILEETIASLEGIAKVEKKAIVACPECGLVSVYSESDIQSAAFPTPDPFESGECILVLVEVGCDGAGCEVPKGVHTIFETEKRTWKPRVAPKDWKFSHDARCRDNHQLMGKWKDSPRMVWQAVHSDFWSE